MLVLSSFLLLTSLQISNSLQIGVIRNAWWDQIPTSIQTEILSCDQCICIMLQSLSTMIGFNCYLNYQTCNLFTNYSMKSSMKVSDQNSTFYFLVSPPKTSCLSVTTTAVNQLQIITTESISFTQIFWPFDNNTLDMYDVYNGIIINNASYSSPGINGYGSSIVLRSNLYQYVNVSSSPLDLSNSSFTFELWINANTIDQSYFYGLIGQCTSNSANMCLHVAIRNRQSFLGFFENDCVGQTLLNTSTWYHLAFVYSYELRRQIIYVNGYMDGQKYSANPFQGLSKTTLTIGMILPNERWSFDGQIDQMSFINRAKSSMEILDDATLVVHYSFDSNLLDSGPMKINGTGVNISFLNQTVEFSHFLSNVQATGFILLGTSNLSYSIVFWIYPYSTTTGCLVYLSTQTIAPTWCLPLLGFSASGSIIAQQYNGSNVITITSETIPNATWTHVAYTYSINIGIQLYINGILTNTSIPFSYFAMSQPGSIILGLDHSMLSQDQCDWQPNSIGKTQYYGLMDDFYLYSRQLNINEIQNLATR